MDEARELLEWVLHKMYGILEKEVIKKYNIHEISKLNEVLGEERFKELFEMNKTEQFEFHHDYFYVDENEELISLDTHDFTEMVEEAYEEMKYADQLKLIKKGVEEIERNLSK